MDNTKDTPMDYKPLITIAMQEYADKQNASLKLELQKHKELNAELVLTLNSVSNAFHTSNIKYIDWMPTRELNESMRLLEVLLNKVNNP